MKLFGDEAPVLIWMCEPNKLRYYFNKKWLEFTHRSLEEELGNGWMESVFPEDRQKYLETFQKAFERKDDYCIAYRLKAGTEEYRWVMENGSPLFSSEGRFTGYLGCCADITPLKRREEILREKERMERDFVADVSHDLRTPIAAIQGFTETLLQGAIHDSKNCLRFLKLIEKHAVHLNKLLEDLLTLSALEFRKAAVSLEPIPLADFVTEFVQGLAPLVKKKNVLIKMNIHSKIMLYSDRKNLSKIFQNLITNSIKFSPMGGWIKVSAYEENDEVVVSIQDHGRGISNKDLPTIFDRFNGHHGSAHPNQSHTGLGLHITKQIVNSSGGRIWVESVEGTGSTFSFTLPTHRSKISSPIMDVKELATV